MHQITTSLITARQSGKVKGKVKCRNRQTDRQYNCKNKRLGWVRFVSFDCFILINLNLVTADSKFL